MTTPKEPVAIQYTVEGMGERILSVLKSQGKDVNHLTATDLAPVDGFHIRGREATQELVKLVELNTTTHVLDVGSGIGGSARYLASEYGCMVTGIDLTNEFCEIARMLSERTGLSDKTSFRQGSALDMPFESDSFDVAWTEHVQMNIADKTGFYKEIARVLKSGGKFLFHDIFQSEGGEVHFPVPWANDRSISFLATVDELKNALDSAGLQVIHWEDKTELSTEWFHEMMENIRTNGPMPLGVHLLMGETAPVKFRNLTRSLEEKRIVVIQAVLEKAN